MNAQLTAQHAPNQARLRGHPAATAERAHRLIERKSWPLALLAASVVALGGCASTLASRQTPQAPSGNAAEPARAPLARLSPSNWAKPLPQTSSVADLVTWWQRFEDPLLSSLIDQAQTVSSPLGGALARVEAARAARVGALAALGPRANAGATLSRSSNAAATTLLQGNLQASWELDVFGGGNARKRESEANLAAAQAGWHEARVMLAAEVGQTYLALRLCQRHVALAQTDATSREETLRLNDTLAKGGLLAPAQVALASASLAEARNRLNARQASCEELINALVALSARPRSELAAALGAPTSPAAGTPLVPPMTLASIPAQTLAQRPDLARSGFDVVLAAAQIDSAQAARLPQISLSGNIGAGSLRAGGRTMNDPTWSIGPLAISLPIFDGGQAVANVSSAQAQYRSAVLNYNATVRQAVREVENALASIASTQERAVFAQTAALGYRATFTATQAKHRAGLASTLELEETRRLAMLADGALLDLGGEEVAAWIALYRAAGGGFDASVPPATGVLAASLRAAQ